MLNERREEKRLPYLKCKLDKWFAAWYGLGRAASFIFWLAVPYVLLSNYDVYVSPMVTAFCMLIGGIGTYYYGIRSYEKKLR